MTDSTTPFGLSLLRERLAVPTAIAAQAPDRNLSLGQPHLDIRSIAGGRPNATDRGLASGSGAPARLWGVDRQQSKDVSLSRPEAFLRELSELHVRGMFAMKRPANVDASHLHENDSAFTGRAAAMAQYVRQTARRFGVHPGLLAEHLVAETDYAEFSRLPANATLAEYLGITKVSTAALGLDDFVSDRAAINHAVPAASGIGAGRPSNPIAAESALNAALKRGASAEDIAKLMKPQLELPLGDAIAASAAYLKYKSLRASRLIPEFDLLPSEIQFQLTRLFVNPPAGQKNPHGINFIIRESNAGRYMNLFDFSDRTAQEANDPTKAKDVYRRATIHTARALHMEQDILTGD